MIIVLTLRKEFHYEIEVSAVFATGKTVYTAELSDAGTVSHFDMRADYSGATIEEAVGKIAAGLDKALEMLHSM